MAGKRHRVVKEQNVPSTMRDGTVLRADIYRPETGGKFATLLSRTPYDKARDEEPYRRLAERGYSVVVQDVRGRYASGGEFRPGFYSSDHRDAEDGYDSVEWAASLPWSTGRVGTFGGSYVGWTQWELAHTRPPHLTAMAPQAIAANLLDREMGGVLRLGRVLWWTVNTLSPDQRVRAGLGRGPLTTDEAERFWTGSDRSKWLWYLPLKDIPDEAMYGMGEHWRRWLDDHATDHFGFLKKHPDVEVPALITTGWYDQQIGAIKHLAGMRENAATEHARQGTRLIIGPWTHASFNWETRVGDVDFGPEASRDYFDIADQWFSYWLRGEKNGVEEWPPIQLFVMGANKWRAESEWPLARTAYTDFYFHAGGLLSAKPPAEEPSDGYDYDPRNRAADHIPRPRPTLPGNPAGDSLRYREGVGKPLLAVRSLEPHVINFRNDEQYWPHHQSRREPNPDHPCLGEEL